MKGTSHAIIGGFVGGLVSVGVGNDVMSLDTGVLVILGSVAGLVPDLDTNGKLSNNITISHKIFKVLSIIVGLFAMLYSLFIGVGVEKVLGIIIGVVLIVTTRYITQKRMLTLTGVGVLLLGIIVSKLWVILLGIYVVVASMLGHRTYTHSLIGLIYFWYIAYLIGLEFYKIEGLFLVLILGYVSHLVADLKVFNRQGVKLLRPFINIEF